MPEVKNEESPIVSREDCEVLLKTHSIDAFRAHKLIDKDIYNAEIPINFNPNQYEYASCSQD